MTHQIDTGTQDLLAALDDGVWRLTLNQPEARNAMSEPMNRALAEQLAWAEVAPAVKCVVLTGAGQGLLRRRRRQRHGAERTHESAPATLDEAIHRRVNSTATAGRLFKMSKPALAVGPLQAPGWHGRSPAT